MYGDFLAGVEQASREFDLPRPPLAVIGGDILFEEGILVEAEVTAVIDRSYPLPDENGEAEQRPVATDRSRSSRGQEEALG